MRRLGATAAVFLGLLAGGVLLGPSVRVGPVELVLYLVVVTVVVAFTWVRLGRDA